MTDAVQYSVNVGEMGQKEGQNDGNPANMGAVRLVRRLIALAALALGVGGVGRAQIEPPISAPLLAFDLAGQDRVALYDLGADQWRILDWRAHPAAPYGAWVRVWGFGQTSGADDECRLLLTMSQGAAPGDLYLASLDGRDLIAPVRYDGLPAGTWGVWEPAWSPDGSKIAATFIGQQTGADGTPVYEYRVGWIAAQARPRSADPLLVSVTGDEHTPTWSPDGAQLAYVSYDRRVPGADIFSTAAPTPPGAPDSAAPLIREADIWIVGADNPDATKFRLTDFPIGSVSMPRWSPDGDLIAFTFSPAPNQDLIWMIGAARGAVATQLTVSTALALDLTWLPDGAALVAALRGFGGDSTNRLWRVPLTGAAQAESALYSDAPYADFPRFSPDGRWLALRSGYTMTVIDLRSGERRALIAPDGVQLGNTPAVWGGAACGA